MPQTADSPFHAIGAKSVAERNLLRWAVALETLGDTAIPKFSTDCMRLSEWKVGDLAVIIDDYYRRRVVMRVDAVEPVGGGQAGVRLTLTRIITGYTFTIVLLARSRKWLRLDLGRRLAPPMTETEWDAIEAECGAGTAGALARVV